MALREDKLLRMLCEPLRFRALSVDCCRENTMSEKPCSIHRYTIDIITQKFTTKLRYITKLSILCRLSNSRPLSTSDDRISSHLWRKMSHSNIWSWDFVEISIFSIIPRCKQIKDGNSHDTPSQKVQSTTVQSHIRLPKFETSRAKLTYTTTMWGLEKRRHSISSNFRDRELCTSSSLSIIQWTSILTNSLRTEATYSGNQQYAWKTHILTLAAYEFSMATLSWH